MHTFLVKLYNETNDLKDSYTLEAATTDKAISQIKSKLQNDDTEQYRFELEDLTVKASAGATAKDQPVESAPMDEIDEEDEPETVATPDELIPENKDGQQAPDASDDFEDQAKLLTEENINPPIKKGTDKPAMSVERQKEANKVKQELVTDKTKK